MAIRYRIKCPSCGTVSNVSGNGPCPRCGSLISVETPASFSLYRMGDFRGSATGLSIYINNEPYGQIGNRECLTFPMPYGEYLIHIACGMNRKCNDPVIKLSPEDPNVYMQIRMKAGFFQNSFILNRADPSTMPQ